MQPSWTRPVVAAALALAAAWLLAPGGALLAASGRVLLVEGTLLSAALASPRVAARRVVLGITALASLSASVIAPALWPASAAGLLTFALVSAASGIEPRACRDARLAVLVGVVVPALLLSALALGGGIDARHAILGAVSLGWPDPWKLALVVPALVLGAWTALLPARRAPGRSNTGLAWVLVALSTSTLALRATWVASFASLPSDLMTWSEPPFLLDLLKLRTGHALYGPMQEVNSYAYAPLLQLLHHALLAPFGLDLSLAANRVLCLFWQLATAGVLVWALRSRIERGPDGRVLSRWTLVVLCLAAAVSSFLAPYVHPDHALMLCFAFAAAALLGEERMPRTLFVSTLVLVPALATAFKLTGAGIGLGLVFVMLLERRRRELAWLGLGAVIALSVIPLFDHTLGVFSAWSIWLFAAQPLRWHRLLDVPFLPAGRLALVSVAACAICRWRLGPGPWFVAARRMAALAAGFAITSLPAFLKVGGRDNDLMPLAIAGSVLLLLAATALARRTASGVVLPAAALAVALVLVPPAPPCPAALGTRVAHAERELEARVRGETRAGRHTLLYASTLAWIRAGRRDVPLDRVQSGIELYAAGRPELAAGFARFDRVYDSVVSVGAVFEHGDRWDARFVALVEKHLHAHYELVRPPGDTAPSGEPTSVLLFRRVHEKRR